MQISAIDAKRALGASAYEVITTAAKALDRGETEWSGETDDDPAGVTYYDAGTELYYAANISECAILLKRIAAGESAPVARWREGGGAVGALGFSQGHETRCGARCRVA